MPTLANPLVHVVLGMAPEVGRVHQKFVQLAASKAACLSGHTELTLVGKSRIRSLVRGSTLRDLLAEQRGQLCHDWQDFVLNNAILLAVIAKDCEFVLVAFDGLDQHSNLIDRVESIVKANQTLRQSQEVDLILAWHP